MVSGESKHACALELVLFLVPEPLLLLAMLLVFYSVCSQSIAPEKRSYRNVACIDADARVPERSQA